MKLLLSVFFLVFQIAFAQTVEEKNLEEFNSLKVGGSLNVMIRQSDRNYIELKGSGEDLDNVMVEIVEERLEISLKNKKWGVMKNFDVTVRLEFKDLSEIEIGGASNLETKGSLNAEQLQLRVSGASNLKMELKCNELNMEGSGASDVFLRGSANEAYFEISGASDLHAFDLQAKTAEVEASGASDARITVSGSLKAIASGASDISYKGSPEITNVAASGSSDIEPVE